MTLSGHFLRYHTTIEMCEKKTGKKGERENVERFIQGRGAIPYKL